MGRGFVWISGGLCCAIGLLSLIYSFGPKYTEGNCLPTTGAGPSCAGINTALASAGSDALNDLALKGPASIAIPLIGLGIVILISQNVGAWKRTGGY